MIAALCGKSNVGSRFHTQNVTKMTAELLA
jgi:hypothetical protein